MDLMDSIEIFCLIILFRRDITPIPKELTPIRRINSHS